MIYLSFEKADDTEEPLSTSERTARRVAESTLRQDLESVPDCGCREPFAVLRVSTDPERLRFTYEGVESSCCSLYADRVERELREPTPIPVPAASAYLF